MPTIFVSHSSEDVEFIEETLIPLLKSRKLEVWYSSEAIKTAGEFQRLMKLGLESSDWVLVALSPSSVRSKWVQAEVGWAFANRENRIIPVLIETCDLFDLDFRLNRLQFADFRHDQSKGAEQLLALFDKPASRRTKTYYNNKHIDKIRVHAEAIVQRPTGLEHLTLKAQLKAQIDSQQAPLTHILEEHARLVVTAGRGAGKTTFIKQRLSALCVTVVDQIKRKKEPASVLVPVYVELDQLNSDRTGVPYKAGDLLRLVLDNLGYLADKHPEQTFAELLDTFKLVLFLDGLNELPPRDQSACRTELFRLDQALTAAGKGQSLRIVLASRPLGFGKHSEEFEKRGWKTAEVLPLELEDIESELTRALGYRIGPRVFVRLEPKRRQILSTLQNLDHFIKWCHDRHKDDLTKRFSLDEIADDIVRQSASTFLKHQVDRYLNKQSNEDTAFVEEILSHLAYETVRVGTSFPYSKVEPGSGSPSQPITRRFDYSNRDPGL